MHFLETHKKQLYISFAALILLGSTALLFYHLGREPFQDYDEATYAEVTTESLAHGNYISLTYLNSPYFRKPPLLIWINDIDTKIFAPSLGTEFAMRLSSVVAAVLTIFVVMLIGYEVAGWGAALLAGSILATTTAFMEPAREVRFDILVSLFITATFYAFLRAMLRPNHKLPLQAQASQEKSVRGGNKAWYIAAGIFFGLAFLSKDVISAFAGVAVLSYILAAKDFRFSLLREFLLELVCEKYVWLGVFAALVVIVPWHLYETIRFGTAFWKSYLGTEVFSRVSTDIFGSGVGPTNASYVSYFFSAGAPWSELLLLGIVAFAAFWKKMPRVSRDVCIASLVTLLVIIGIMLSSHTKALSYLIPLYPFLAIFLALLALQFWDSFLQHTTKDEQLGALAICVVVFAYCFYATSLNVLHLSEYYQYELQYTKEEQTVGELIKASGPDPLVYTYNDYDMGTILYYSALPFTKNQYIYLLRSSSEPTADSLVFMTSAANPASTTQELSSALPEFSYTPLFMGQYVSLFGVSPQTLGSAHK